jgi:hypothetical protein
MSGEVILKSGKVILNLGVTGGRDDVQRSAGAWTNDSQSRTSAPCGTNRKTCSGSDAAKVRLAKGGVFGIKSDIGHPECFEVPNRY